MAIVVDYFAKQVSCEVTVPGVDTCATVTRLKSYVLDGHAELAYITLNRMRRCCKAMGALIAPALARSGIYGVCYCRFRWDMHRSGLN